MEYFFFLYPSSCFHLRERSFILVPPGPGRIWGATKFFRPVWGATKFFRPIWGATRFFKRVWGAAKFFRLVWGATKFFRPTWSLEGNFLDLIGGLRKFSDRFWGLRNFLDQFGGLRNFLDPLGGLRNFSDLFGGLRNELKVRPSPPGTSINDRSLKSHKLSIDEKKQVKPDEVHQKIPARLVVGMSSCQLSRIQSWLEAFLTPLSKEFGVFETRIQFWKILRPSINKQ